MKVQVSARVCISDKDRLRMFYLVHNNLVDIIRLVARLFQQVRYSHDITILLQPCVVNLVTFLFIMTVSDLLEQHCDKSDNAIKLVTSC